MNGMLLGERERTKELIGKLHVLEQELEQKNKQITDQITSNS